MCRARCKGLHQTLFRCFSSQQTYKKESTFGRETAEKSGAVEIQWGTAVYFSDSGKGRKMGLGNSLACSGGADRLLSPPIAKAPKGLRTATSPPMTFVKTSKLPLREPRKRARGGNRTEIGEPHAPKEMQDESRKPVSCDILPPATERHAAGTRPPRQPCEGDGLQKDKRGLHAGGLHPEREKPSEALFFPSFCTRRECLAAKKFRLCGRRLVFLRKAILFLPRKNDHRDGEMLHTNSFFIRFLTIRLLFATVRPVIETRKRKESLSS